MLVALRLIYYSEDFKYGGIFLETDFGTELAEYVPEKGGTTIDGDNEGNRTALYGYADGNDRSSLALVQIP